MLSNYWIGSSALNTAPIDALFARWNDCEPASDRFQYAEQVNLFDFTRRKLGIITQVWHWSFLGETMRNSLKAYDNTTVYVRTRQDDGTFAYFSAVLVWPEQEPEHTAGRVLDLSIELRNLQPFTYEVP